MVCRFPATNYCGQAGAWDCGAFPSDTFGHGRGMGCEAKYWRLSHRQIWEQIGHEGAEHVDSA